MEDPVEIAMKKFENHPILLSSFNKETSNINELFQFSEVTSEEILSEISNFGNKKVGSYKNIPTKILKEPSELSYEYLMKIWNKQVIMQTIESQHRIPNELKPADITLIFKETILYWQKAIGQ